MTHLLSACLDSRLVASLARPRPLSFERADTARDLPSHVRAGSAVRRWGQRIVVIQDDVHALALLDDVTSVIAALPLPPGSDGRRSFSEAQGNKALKMDLEASIVLPDGRLLALGSGSTKKREQLVLVNEALEVRSIDGGALYAHLRSRHDFAGSELNIEGACIIGDVLHVLQRGNGAARDGLEPVNAIGDLRLDAFLAWLDGGPPPTLVRVRQFDLGSTRGVRFGFTDATALPDGRMAFLAGAEDSPDSYRDGDVVGCRFGIIDGDEVRVTDIVDEQGMGTRLKLEGIDWAHTHADGTWELTVVADMDDPNVPAVMATLLVRDSSRH